MLSQELVGAAMAEALASEHLPPGPLAQRQERKWRALVRHAVAHAPFYARLYQGIDVERAALTDLPVVTKEMVQDHFDEVVTDPALKLAEVQAFANQPRTDGSRWFRERFAVMLSSGTSGRRGYYIWDAQTLADAIAVGFRQSNRPGPGKAAAAAPQRIAAIMLTTAHDAAAALLRLIPEAVGPKCLIDIEEPLDSICTQLNEFQPTLLSAFPYTLRLLGERQQDGRLSIQPARLTCSGDVLTASDRAFIQQAFGRPLFNYYCSTEAPYLAWECAAHEGLHVNADYVIVESVDRHNHAVPVGQRGERLLLTNLSNQAMPLIRYVMSDQVEYMAVPCSCGCLLPRIRTVAGRVEHILHLPDACDQRVALIPEHIDAFLGGLPGLLNYQIIQQGPAQLLLNMVCAPGAASAVVAQTVSQALSDCCRRYAVDETKLQIEQRCVARLEPVRPGGTKVCHFWNRWEKG